MAPAITTTPQPANKPGSPAVCLDHLPAELRLLLLCSRPVVTPELHHPIRELADSTLDWELVAAAAEAHGLVPLLLRNLTHAGAAVPDDVLSRLQGRAREIACSNLLLAAEVTRIAGVFSAAGVEFIPYKGPALGISLYNSLALRPSGDLDFFVKSGDLDRVKEVLLATGYEQDIHSRRADWAAHVRVECATDFINRTKGMRVDLHHAVAPRHLSVNLKLDDIFARAGEADFGLGKLRMLSPEDLLLVLCIHGSKHQWQRLIWLCDVAALLSQSPQLNWEWLVAESQRLRVERMVLLAMTLARTSLGAELPREVRQLCSADEGLFALRAQVVRNWLGQRSSSFDADRWLFLLRIREHRRDRVVCAWRYARTLTVEGMARRALPAVFSRL